MINYINNNKRLIANIVGYTTYVATTLNVDYKTLTSWGKLFNEIYEFVSDPSRIITFGIISFCYWLSIYKNGKRKEEK